MSNSNLLKIIFISSCISLTVENLFCQPENIEFRHYTINNGLSNGYVIMKRFISNEVLKSIKL
jgi:hypothetical protein